jgi:hypothetical protein
MITEKEYTANLDMYQTLIKSLLEERNYKVTEEERDFYCEIDKNTIVECHGDGLFLYFQKNEEKFFLYDAFKNILEFLNYDNRE